MCKEQSVKPACQQRIQLIAVTLNDTILGAINQATVKILKFGTPQTIAIIVLKLVKFDVTLH